MATPPTPMPPSPQVVPPWEQNVGEDAVAHQEDDLEKVRPPRRPNRSQETT